MIFRILDFYRLSYLGCPDFMGTVGFGCCISPPSFLVMLAMGWGRTLSCWYGQGPWRVVEHANGWCLRGIYNYGGLWGDGSQVSAPSSSEVITVINRTENKQHENKEQGTTQHKTPRSTKKPHQIRTTSEPPP